MFRDERSLHGISTQTDIALHCGHAEAGALLKPRAKREHVARGGS